MPPKKRSFVFLSWHRCHRTTRTMHKQVIASTMHEGNWRVSCQRRKLTFFIMSFTATYNPGLTPRWWPYAMNKDWWEMITASWWPYQWKKDWRVLTTISILYFSHNGCVKARNPNKSVLSRKTLLRVSSEQVLQIYMLYIVLLHSQTHL